MTSLLEDHSADIEDHSLTVCFLEPSHKPAKVAFNRAGDNTVYVLRHTPRAQHITPDQWIDAPEATHK